MRPIRIGFICVHNSCRSQIAEAVAKVNYPDKTKYEFYSAGTQLKNEINPDAVNLIKQQYEMDITKTQHPKLITLVPNLDVIISMGCNVDCSFYDAQYKEDWGLEDPTGKDMFEFLKTMNTIEMKIDLLIDKLESKQIKIK